MQFPPRRARSQRICEICGLAVKFTDGAPDLRHYEVQVSINPRGYICRATKAIQKKYDISANSSKRRSSEIISCCVKAWIESKFQDQKRKKLREELAPGEWSYHFVVHKVYDGEELRLFDEAAEVDVVRFDYILSALKKNKEKRKLAASGRDLVDLVLMEIVDPGDSHTESNGSGV